MDTDILRVGIRKFRENLPEYLMAELPVAITKHGETLGFYIPAKHSPEIAETNALIEAAEKLEKLLISKGLTEDELVKDFQAIRRKKI